MEFSADKLYQENNPATVSSRVHRSLDPNRKREIKIFICSTFRYGIGWLLDEMGVNGWKYRDMKEERSLLVSKIFPQIHSVCQQRNVSFSFVDLRWGITEVVCTL